MARAMIFTKPDSDPKSLGWRLRIEREEGDMAKLSAERVLPEKVNDPDANLTEPADCLWLTREDAVWLLNALDTILHGWPSGARNDKVS